MDKDQARFILHSFRPDGADVEDEDFTEALKLAMENRELGEWLANERAFDAAFAKALCSVELPGNLREDIIGCLAAERGDFPQAQDATDSAWIGALASIQPPDALRKEVLAAMDRTVAVEDIRKKPSVFKRFAIPLAAAAGIALGLIVTRPTATNNAMTRAVPVEVVQAGFMRTYTSPTFHLEDKGDNPQTLINIVREKKLPCPGKLPPGLRDKKGIGCRELEINGIKGSLICFKVGEGGVVHIMVFSRDDVSGYFPPKDHPEFLRKGDWSTARWEDGGKVFLVMSDTMGDRLPELF